MSRRRPSALQEFTGINITPLMDLTFLLLIVFMITAPMLEYAVDVTPPEYDAERIDDTEDILINLTRDGEIVIDERRSSAAELAGRLEELFTARPDASILIRGHEERPYGEVIEIMRISRNIGFQTVGLITRAEEE